VTDTDTIKASRPSAGGGTWKAAIAWSTFDWANSAFPTIISTFVFAAYFTKAVAPTPEVGTAQWGWTMGIVGLVIAVLGPVVGATADHTGRRKPWLAGFSALCIGATALLWFTEPDVSDTLWALVFVGLASIAFELAIVFYNAMLPSVAPPGMMGRVSGWAWGLGYIGGLVALVVALFAFVQAETPLFGLDKATAEHVRVTTLLVAVWYAVFCLPTFLYVPDTPAKHGLREAFRLALRDIRNLWGTFRAHPHAGRFLIARMIYTDGLNTLFAFGGIYAGGTFGMTFEEIVLLGIGMNVTAGLGAAAFGWMDDWAGPKPTVVTGLAGLAGLGAVTLFITDKAWFWVLALPMGLFFGPVQAASRSFMARLAPPGLVNEMFGLYALSGRITAFLGPLLLGWATSAFASQRAGMATILVFLGVGLILLLRVAAPPQDVTPGRR